MKKKGRPLDLKVCLNCDWFFRISKTNSDRCPRCHSKSEDAFRVYADNGYKYAKTQERWRDRLLEHFNQELLRQIEVFGDT